MAPTCLFQIRLIPDIRIMIYEILKGHRGQAQSKPIGAATHVLPSLKDEFDWFMAKYDWETHRIRGLYNPAITVFTGTYLALRMPPYVPSPSSAPRSARETSNVAQKGHRHE